MLICLGVVLSLMTWFSATAVLPELSTHYSLTASESAWLTSAVQLGFALGALLSSMLALSDRWPLTRLMAGATLLAGCANAILLLEVNAETAIAARFLTGAALAGIYPPAVKLVATWFKTHRRLAVGIMVGALTLGSAMPYLVRAGGSELPWRAVLATCSLASFAAAGIFGWLLREGPHAFARATIDLRQTGAILRNRPVMLANLGYFGHMWELYAMWSWFLVYVTNTRMIGPDLHIAALITFSVIASGAIGCLSGGWLADRIGRCNTTILMMALSGISAVFIGVFHAGPLWLFLTIAIVWGFSVVGDSAQFSAAVTELADSLLVGSSLAFQMSVGFAITMITIWLVPHIADALGSWRWSFLVLVPGPLLGIAAMLLLRREERAQRMAGGLR